MMNNSTTKILLFSNVWILKRLKQLTFVLTILLFSGSAFSQTSWYSYQSGNWTDWRTWTTDPSGTTLINPTSTTPSSAINNTVVILNGRTVTIAAAVPAITTTSFTIQEGAVLDLTTNINAHVFGTLSGSGMLRLATAVFPAFAVGGSFVSAGGGTVEYYGLAGGFTLSQLTYNNLILNITNTADEAFYDNATALIINGDLTLRKGTLRIGRSAAGGAARTVRVFGNTVVDATGQILVGAQNYRHQIYLSGDLTNNGIVRFTTLAAELYNANPGAAVGYSDVIFDNGLKDQYVTCNNTTNFYRIQVSKGTDQTYVLNIDASNSANFRLMGRNDQQDYDPTPPDPPALSNPNALGILSGTLRLGQNIVIPSLSTNAYVLDEDAGIWFDGSTVTMNSVTAYSALFAYGTVRFSSNCQATFLGQIGLVLRESGNIIIESGNILTRSCRTSVLAGNPHRGAFKIYGGTLTLGSYDVSGATTQHATFSIAYPENVFIMTGGTIDIQTSFGGGGAANNFSLMLGSLPKNIEVTGGTIRISTTPRLAYMNSTVPLPNLEVYGTANSFQVRGIAGITALINPLPLVVQQNFTLQNTALFNNTQNVNVQVGGNFNILTGTTYTPGTNTTIFNGTGSQTLDIQGTISGNLNNLTLSGASSLTVNNASAATPVIVRANLQIDAGCTLNDNGRIIDVRGNITNSGTHFKPVSGAGSIQLTGVANQVISGNGSGKFNNLTLNKTGGTVAMQSNMTVTGELRLANTSARLNIGTSNLLLTATGDVYDNISGTGKTFDQSRMIQTSGLMSDGGVSKVYSNTTAYVFPFGFYNSANATYYYMPASIRFSNAPAAYGTVTSRPVNSRHPLAQTTNSLSCYWKTTQSGFSGVPAGSVIHNYTYDAATNYFVGGGAENAYIPAVFRNNASNSWTSINNPVLVNEGSNIVTYDTAFTADGEYTAGESNAFASIPILYSTGTDGDWSHTATWSSVAVGGPAGTSVPDANTIVIIGDATHNHTVVIYQNGKVCGSLTIFANSVLDLRNYTGHNFEALPEKGVTGTGTMRIASNSYFPRGDFGEFIGENGGTVEYYTLTGASITMPLTSDVTGLVLNHYYNLKMSPVSGTWVSFPNSDLTIYNDLTKSDAGEAITNTIAIHTIQVNHNLSVEAGTFLFQNTNIQTVKVLNNLIVNGSFTVLSSAPVNHILELFGDLSGTGTFDASVINGRILTYFKGSTNTSISGAAKDFYSLEVNKGTDQTPILNVRSNITTSFDPAVRLRNGTFRIKQSTFNLSTNRSFTIPETGCLSIDSVANVTVSNNNGNDSTLFLTGKLEVLAGTLNVGNMGNTRRNCIEYSSDGVPTIDLVGGILNVNGQIKRNSLTTQGSLRFSQSGGVLNIYGKVSDNTRAKFEICNDNSSFTFSGGTINIYRGAGVDFGDLYLRPSGSSVTGGTINLAPGSAIGSQTYNIDATCNLHHLNITSFNAGNIATARIMVNPLILTGDLNIGTNSSTLNCNNKNVLIAGNYTNNGVYTAGTNTTTFNGGNTQTATFGVNTLFKKVVIDKTVGTAITFSSPGAFQPTISDTLAISQGTLTNAGALNIVLQGDVINNGIHTSTGAGSLLLQGTRNQVISGNNSGQFGNLTLANGAANGATLAADATINGALTLTTGYLYINDFLLTLSSSSSISGTPGVAGNRNWIITNGVLSDGGVKKIYPAVSGTSFTFPMGVAGKYTPVTYAVTFGTPGSITLKPVNIKIPSLTDALSNELQYYWNVSSSGFGGMTSATHTYTYLQSDVTGNEAIYVGARYYTNIWTNLGTGVINTGANTISFTQNYIDGEYTCGEPPNFLTKPVYYSFNLAPNINTTGADWNVAGSWATGGHGGPAATVPPDGNPVIIASGHRINVTTDDRSAYSVLNGGTLNLNNKVGLNFGHVSGAGRIIMSNTGFGQFVFPGGDFTDFMNTTGSTIEYNGASGVLSNISPIIRTYQNLEFTGPISKTMSSMNILVKGSLLISESQLINSVYNKNITVWGNWTDNVSSGFVPGTGIVSLEGTSLQTISTTSGPEHFSRLRINNPAGATLSGSAEVAGWLYLTNGRINTNDANLLTITSTLANPVTGGSDASFVDGPLSKQIIAGQSFNFPVGNYNGASAKPARYGNILVSGVNATNYWKARYVNADPDGTYSRLNLLSPITSVSNNEYWIVNRPGANTANIRLRWDAASSIASVASTRVTEWVTNQWEEKGSLVSGSLSSGTVATTTPVSTDDYVFTLGVSGVTARINSVSPATICNNGEVVTVSVTLTGTPNWTLTYLAGTNSFTQSGIGSGTYNIQLTGADLGGPGTPNIQLIAVWDITGPGVVDASLFPVVVKPTSIPDIQGTFTVGAAEIRNFNTASNAGSSYAWSWQGASGGTIASPAADATNITITTPGSFPTVYQLQVVETSSNGCVAQDVQAITVVNAPSPVISPGTANQCQGNVVNYSTPLVGTHTYAWTVVGGTPVSGTGNTISVTWNTVGNGSVTVVENNAGITGTDVVNVVVDPQPLIGLTVSAPSTVCYDNIAIVTVAGSESGFSYQLRDGAIPIGSASAGTGGNIGLSSLQLTAPTTFNVLAYNNGCSSQLTQTVTVNISDPAAPTGTASQSFCVINNPTIASLTAVGTAIQWYASAIGGTPLPAGTVLSDASSYYASQTILGCESRNRFAVAVTVNNPAAPTGSATQSFCAIDNPTVANLTATGTAIKWYSAATGGTALVTTTALATGNYYASQTVGTCESALRFAVAVTVNNPAAPTGSATQSFCTIDNPTVANLTATGTAIKWYSAATGGTALVTTTALATGNYYASQTVGTCESALRFAVAVTVNNPAAPTGSATQSFCTIDNPTVANLTATGTAIQWYSAATGGTALVTTTALATGTYYASQTVGTCESALRFAVAVTVNNPAAPTGSATQSFCAIDNPTVANLTATGTAIKWYSAATGGTALVTTTALATGTYYASQTVGTCESALRFAVAVTVNNPAAPTGSATQSFCAIDNPTVVNLTATGTAIKWYSAATGGTALVTTTALATGTYYASQTVGTCESALRFAVAVTVNNPAAPTGSATQSFCAIDNPTVVNLTATGTAIKWYSAATGGTALVTTTALATGNYYASQTVGTCESALRFAVAVTVNNPAAPTGSATQSFCTIDNPTVANLTATGTAIKWYSAATGGTALVTTTALATGTYYASQTVGTCESALRFAVAVTVNNPAAPTGSATQSFCTIDNPTVANLTATGTAIKWYSAATGGTALVTTTALATGTYYASQTVGTCESALRFAVAVTVNNPAAPTGSATQSFCTIDNPTVANLTATGTAIKWYSAATGGTALVTTTALATGTYYASQTVGACESALRFAVAVTVNNPAAPTGSATQSFCAIDYPTVANLTATGTAIKWYSAATGGTALVTTTALATGTYYASQTVGTCESSLRFAVAVTVNNPAAPTGSATQSFCAIDNPTVANLTATGTAIKWYSAATGGTALVTTTALATGTYYASQTVGTCESALRFAVAVTVNNPAAPTGSATQSFCTIDNPTVANLTATGTAIKWYSAATGGTALVTTTALATGTYYASQTVGACESALRFAVAVTVNNPAAPTGSATQSFCAIDNPTVANLTATGTAIKWYSAATGGTALVTTTALATGNYYASQTVGTCESALRFAVAVTVNNPAAPTGSATQSFCAINNPTVANLTATGTAIKWYSAATGGTALVTTTALATGTYYASQTVGTCESALRFAVAVTVNNPVAPTGSATQSFCAIDNPTVANLTATGTAIKWYSAATGGTALVTTTALATGTYYASQTVGTCESALRFAVAVTVNNPAAPTGSATQSFCAIDNPTVANLTATGTAIKWYSAATGGTALVTTTALATGNYYASQTVGTCESALRFAVAVTVNNPAAPTGSATQSFCAIDNPTVANLTATGTAIKWYSAATGGTALVTTTALATGTYYASQTVGTCESALRFVVAVTVNNPAAPTGSATQSFCTIDNPTVANLTATGTAIKWYSAATGGTALVTTTALATGTYYASQTVGTCESALRFVVAVTVNNPAAPTGSATQSFCAIDNPTVANLTATGTAIKWYSAATGGTALVTTTALATGTYYASQTVGTCESALRFAVAVTVNNPAAPTGSATQSFCAINNPTVANLTATGTAIQWYSAATGGSALVTTTALGTGTYYASQTVGTCESALRFAAAVTVNNPAAPTGSATQSFCSMSEPLISDLAATGTNLLWYDVPSGGTALPGTTTLADGSIYYVSQTVGACESNTRFAVTVAINDPAAPTGNAIQSFCNSNSPTLADIVVTGTGIEWYDAATGGLPLDAATILTDGTYYASQTIGGCESILRLAVTIVTGNDPVTSVITGDMSPLCSSTGVSYSVVPTAGSSYSWTVPVAAVIVSGATGPDNNEITVDFGTESGTITVTETTSIGCPGIPVQLDVDLVGCDLVADFTASDTNVCISDEVIFANHSLGTTSSTTFEWEFGDGASPASATLSGPHVVNYTTPGLKTVRLIISNGLSDTLVKTDYVLVNAVPGVIIESAERCGPGSIDLTATLINADRVDFSTDEGVTVASTDNSAPYVFMVNLGAAETLHIMGKAYNTASGCSGAWEGDAFAVANLVPVSEEIVSSHIGISVPGYVDVVCSGQQNVIYYVNAESNATYNWNVPGLGITANGVSEIEIDWNVQGGDYLIEVEKVSNKGCYSAKEDTMVLVSQPEPNLGEDVIICEGSSHTFSLSENYESYEWNDGSTDPELTVSESGLVFVTVWDEYLCNGSDTASLLISTTPVVDLGRDTVLCGDNSLELDAGDFDSYSWSTGETVNPITVREGAGNVSVIVTNADGCEGTDEIIIKPCDPVTLLGDITNTITPNDDNVHDTWKINNISLFPDASIQIFDRWGRMIYEQDGGYENDWEGKDSSGKDLPVDTYFYIIDLKIKGTSPISGNITIIR